MSRSYTVEEIDALRRVCEMRWIWGSSILPANGGTSRCYRSEDKDRGVEELVRTAILAGHTANDIYEADRKRDEAFASARAKALESAQ
jgi:hypothetical protein